MPAELHVRSGSRAAVAGRRMAQPVYPGFGIPRAFRHLRFVPTADLSSYEVDVDAGGSPPSLGVLTLARGSPLLAFCRGHQTAVGYCRRGTLRYGPDREINYP